MYSRAAACPGASTHRRSYCTVFRITTTSILAVCMHMHRFPSLPPTALNSVQHQTAVVIQYGYMTLFASAFPFASTLRSVG